VIVVDTSIWVSVLRDPDSAHASTLRAIIDADEVGLALPVRIELMAGVSRQDRAGLRRVLTGLPLLAPTDDTWSRLERGIEPASNAGLRFGLSDLLIAALAEEAGALVWSADGDFQRLEAVGLVRLYG
jgi:predicted nucleic acid-binding protein